MGVQILNPTSSYDSNVWGGSVISKFRVDDKINKVKSSPRETLFLKLFGVCYKSNESQLRTYSSIQTLQAHFIRIAYELSF